MQPNFRILCVFLLTTASRLIIITVLVAASSAASTPQSNSEDTQVSAQVQRVENGIPPIPLGANEPPLQLNLQKLMEFYKVPAVSIAVIDNFRIAWAKAYGVTEAGDATTATTHTLFQAGSISKTEAATGALWLVDHG